MYYNFKFWNVNWSCDSLSFGLVCGIEGWARYVCFNAQSIDLKWALILSLWLKVVFLMVYLWGQHKEATLLFCFLGKGSCKRLSLRSWNALAVCVNSWWVNLIWELALCWFLQPLFFLVWAKSNKCFILIVQVPCLVWIVRPALWGHVLGCKSSESFPFAYECWNIWWVPTYQVFFISGLWKMIIM